MLAPTTVSIPHTAHTGEQVARASRTTATVTSLARLPRPRRAHGRFIPFARSSQSATAVVAADASHDVMIGLGSNAHSLLAGAPIASVRRRLKVASLLYDHVVLEAGTFDVQAGPGGAAAFRLPTRPGAPAAWQTARQRGAVEGGTFTIGVAGEVAPGVPAEAFTTVLATESVIYWRATLEPFLSELPAGCDWVGVVDRPKPIPAEVGAMAKHWTSIDKANAVLAKKFDANHVRSRVIADTNEDLALAAGWGFALTADPLHSEVLASRLDDQVGWRLQGFALPVAIPAVGELPWEAVRDIRKDKSLRYLRSAMHDIESAALEAATSYGDLEAAVHLTLEGELAKAMERTDKLHATTKRTVLSVVVATGIGFATAGITGPLGIVAAALGSSAIGGALDARTALRTKPSRAWVGSFTRIKSAADGA